MKLRIAENSLRLRLSMAEIAELLKTGLLQAKVPLGGGSSQEFQYHLEASNEHERIEVEYRFPAMNFYLPRQMLERWAQDPALVTLEELASAKGRPSLFIEKDLRELGR